MIHWRWLCMHLCVFMLFETTWECAASHFCLIWELCPHGGSDGKLPSPHRWLRAYILAQHASPALKGIATVPYFLDTGYTNELIPAASLHFSSIKLNYLLRLSSGLCSRYVCVYISMQFLSESIRDDVLIMPWLILHGSSHLTINVFLLACVVSLWPISQTVSLVMLVPCVFCMCEWMCECVFSEPTHTHSR